jgi:ribonuclease HII
MPAGDCMTPDPRPDFPTLDLERALWANGALWVAGIDEAGRGAWAGPVAAAAVILPQIVNFNLELKGVRDSKKMTPTQRDSWARAIRASAVTWGVGLASATEIDVLGILPATRLASQRAIASLAVIPDHLLLDYLSLPDLPVPQTALPKGDAISLSIAAASVLAKTTRDAILCELDEQYPGYGFADHKGYGTAAHRRALQRLGPSLEHRMSFEPLRSLGANTLDPPTPDPDQTELKGGHHDHK